ncbi:GDSL-type esterase/lipase family protein [Streptomyces sp. A1499]|uniref:GDSL-type esterase/lipase family protein n=1 Tax=Streptomyces sp. A1499 TaxID=2563104 RepID=UPI00109E36A7|nr:GDSL-type esterase/lipase family protein [Streptomyces sp. A1499]THC48867.1 SGNH/GDSL hydrolase family protein [Streptomyces sp. A1499]
MTTHTSATPTTGTTWTAAFRSAVISPHESIDLFEIRSFTAQTLRQVIRLDGGGTALRLHLSNRYGRQPLHIGGAHLARRTTGSTIDPTTDTPLTVDGAHDFTIPAGADVTTDPLHQTVTAGDEWALTLWLPDDTGPATYSAVPLRTGYTVPGNALTAPTLDGAEDLQELATRHYISGADVLAPTGTPVTVAFGDSWFEGAGTTHDTDNRFPDLLNNRLRAAGHPGWTVNTGISANRLLTDEIGEHALARLQRDALDIPGATHVLIHFGLNDLGIPGQEAYPDPAPIPTAADLITGLTTLADRIHAAGLTAITTTVGPYKDTVYEGYSTPEGVAVAREVNAWIRGADSPFDAYADFAAAVADPADPDRIHDDYDSGDGLHVNDAGAQALADTVDLAILKN